MKRYFIIPAIFVLSLSLFIYGCASGGLTTREKGALAGAGLGAAAGGVIGHAVGHTGSGAAIGGAIGAVGGALVGDKMQAQDQQTQEAQLEAQRAREEAAGARIEAREAKEEAKKAEIAKSTNSCDDYFEKARIAANPEDKVYFYKKGLKLCPNSASAHNSMGEVYLKMGKKKDAEYEFRRTLEIDSDYSPAQRNLDRLR